MLKMQVPTPLSMEEALAKWDDMSAVEQQNIYTITLIYELKQC